MHYFILILTFISFYFVSIAIKQLVEKRADSMATERLHVYENKKKELLNDYQENKNETCVNRDDCCDIPNVHAINRLFKNE